MAKVLVVGGDTRAHSLGWKIARSPIVDKVYFAPGNGGTASVGENITVAQDDFEALVKFAKKEKIDLVVVSPENPLGDGIVDFFEKENLMIFGPTQRAAQIESSKVFSTEFMERHKIPHPDATVANNLAEAESFVRTHQTSEYVIKADGLAAGKGVIVPESQAEAQAATSDIMQNKIFGGAGGKVVFQERLHGQEVSAFALTDGRKLLMLPYSQDHKQAYDGDKGPNTGGVGAYAPTPFVSPKLAKQIEKEIMQATIDGLRAEGSLFKGALYGGLFITKDGQPKVIEFNCRLGDPENQPEMMLVESDLYPVFLEIAQGRLKTKNLKIRPGAAANVVLTSRGYPGEFEVGFPITGLDKISDPDVVVFHGGTKLDNGKIITTGGRVVNVTAYGPDMKSALAKTYAQIGSNGVHFKNMHYRKDIGYRVL